MRESHHQAIASGDRQNIAQASSEFENIIEICTEWLGVYFANFFAPFGHRGQ